MGIENQTRFCVEKEKCTKCGRCINTCSGMVIEWGQDGYPKMKSFERYGWRGCWRCEHCLAVCLTGAISIFDKKTENSLLPPPPEMGDYMERLVVNRRSCRRYLDKNVDPKIISRIISAMASAPTGGNCGWTEYTVIDDKDRVKEIWNIAGSITGSWATTTRTAWSMTVSSSSGNKSFKLHDCKHQGDHMGTSCGRPDACGGKKGTNESMSTPKAYEVVITTSHGLNIIFTNKQGINFRSFAHFVTREDAAKFAETLAKVLAEGTYSELDRCPICGQTFTRQNILSLLKDGRVVHGKCLWSAIRVGELTNDDCKMRRYHVFPKDAPTFDYSNIRYCEAVGAVFAGRFRYCVRVLLPIQLYDLVIFHMVPPLNGLKEPFIL